MTPRRINRDSAESAELQVLRRAIMAADGGNSKELKTWCQKKKERHDNVSCNKNAQSLDTCLVCRNLNSGTTNHGSPLYIATVLDQPKAVALLLDLGASPNFSHPVHGDTCVLHASERGHGDCLRYLLDSPNFDKAAHHTRDRKIFLGQGMPQYQEGGLNPLQVAAMNGRYDEVVMLLEFESSSTDVAGQWIEEKDSFGRDIVQMLCDAWSLKKEGSPMRSTIYSILDRVCKQLGVDTAAIAMPDSTEARIMERERQRLLRARCLKADLRAKQEKLEKGTQAIQRWYKPMHPNVNLMDADNCASIVVGQHEASIRQPIPGVVCFPLLRKEFCNDLWEELHHYEQVAISRPEYGLPLDVRHDGNIGNLQDCGLIHFLKTFQELCEPLVKKHMPDLGPFEVYHAFLTRNSPELEKNATFKMHCDKSDLTFNVCLHKSDDVIGSTVGFYSVAENGSDPGRGGCTCSGSGAVGVVASDSVVTRVYTHEHKVGSVVFHNGSHYHKTDPIKRGTRGSLIIWARLIEDHHRRPKIGDIVHLAVNARVQSGILANGGVGIILDDDGISKEPFCVGQLQPSENGLKKHSYYHVNDLIVIDEEKSSINKDELE